MAKSKKDDILSDLLSDVAEKGRALLGDSWEKAEKFTEDTATELADDLKAYVKKYPLKSLAIAAGMGVLVGVFFKSNKTKAED